MRYLNIFLFGLAVVSIPFSANAAINPLESQIPAGSSTPQGYLDSCEGGWAFDRDTPGKPVKIHFYVDKRAGTDGASPVAEVVTSALRTDVNEKFSRSGEENYGFNWEVPAVLRDNIEHTLYAYAIDTTDMSGKLNSLLFGGPRKCRWPPVPGPSSFPNPLPGSPVYVTSPVAGGVWETGQTGVIRWIPLIGTPASQTVDIAVEPYIACLHSTTAPCKIMQPAPFVIATGVMNNGEYSWKIPNDLPERYLGQANIRLSVPSGVYGMSGIFTIKKQGASGNLTINNPSSASVWQTGKENVIRWMPAGRGDRKVNIYLEPYYACLQSVPSCAIPQPLPYTIAENIVDDKGEYSWLIPASLSSTYQNSQRILIKQVGGGVTGYSDVFTISSQIGTGLVVSSTGSLKGAIGQKFNAKFFVSGGMAPYRWQVKEGQLPSGTSLEYQTFNCITTPCIPPQEEVYVAGIPTTAGDYSFLLEATDKDGQVGQARFSVVITPPYTGIISPSGGETWVIGKAYDIVWSLPGVHKVNIGLQPASCRNNICVALAPFQIAENIVNNGHFTWQIPQDISTRYHGYMYLQISDVSGSNGITSSDFVISSISAGDKFSLISPAGGEIWMLGSSQNIRWESPALAAQDHVNIAVVAHPECLDAVPACAVRVAVHQIITEAVNNGIFAWVLPSDLIFTGRARIMIETSTGNARGESKPFWIRSAGSSGGGSGSLVPGQIVVGTSGIVYVITSDGSKYGFTSLLDLTSRGYRLSQIKKVEQSLLDSVPTAASFNRPAGTSVKYFGKPAVYYLTTALCKEIYPSMATMRQWGVDARQIVTIPNNEQYPDCSPAFVRLLEDTLVRISSSPTVYRVKGTSLLPYASLTALQRDGLNLNKVSVIPQAEFNLYMIGNVVN